MDTVQSFGTEETVISDEPLPTTPNSSLHPKKVMCIWRDWKGVLYYELLPGNQTIHTNKYFSQLDQLKAAFEQKASRIS